MRGVLLLLLVLLGACAEEEEVRISHDYEVPAPYMQTLLATQHEWVAADMPFPDSCITMATRMVLYFDEWDELARACMATPSSAPPSYDAGVLDPDNKRVSACISSGEVYRIHFDNGLTEGRKHLAFVHEVLHGLQYCSGRGRDYTHLDTYVWDVILPRGKLQVKCGNRAMFGEEELTGEACYSI